MPLKFPRSLPWRHGLAVLAAALPLAVLAQAQPQPEMDRQDYSPAERLLLMSDQLKGLQPPMSLTYGFIKSGSLEEGFKESVSLQLKRQPDGSCCIVSGSFFTGARQTKLPEVEKARGNPAVMHFLERDIKEMNRLTKGSANYFRKRIRMALYQGAQVTDANYRYKGKTVAGKEIIIRPYLDDPNRNRFEKLAGKQYLFAVSDAVPGGVLAVRSTILGDAAAQTLIEEELLLTEADSPAHKPLTYVPPPAPVQAPASDAAPSAPLASEPKAS